MMRWKFAALLCITACTSANAEYIRTGPLKATVCTGFGIKVCSQKEVRAVGKDGDLFEPAEVFRSVSEFSGKTCHIRLAGTDAVSSAINSVKSQSFYADEDGKLVKISPDYVTFKCTKK